jgi:hypothetical protein
MSRAALARNPRQLQARLTVRERGHGRLEPFLALVGGPGERHRALRDGERPRGSELLGQPQLLARQLERTLLFAELGQRDRCHGPPRQERGRAAAP